MDGCDWKRGSHKPHWPSCAWLANVRPVRFQNIKQPLIKPNPPLKKQKSNVFMSKQTSPPSPHSDQVPRPLSWRSFLRFSLLLAAIILLVYSPALCAQFNWDDEIIVRHAFMRTTEGLSKIWLAPSEAICGDYWPIDYTTHWIEYQLWGVHPMGYHAVNILLHIFNACLLFYLLRRIAVPGAFLVTILFAIHPAQISSVAWIVERKDLLNTFFYFLAFLAWMRFEEKRSPMRYLLVLLFFTASLLSKSMSITWPAAAFLYSWWRAGKIEWRRLLIPLLPLLLFAFALVFILKAQALDAPPIPPELAFSIPQKIILAGKNLTFYAGKLLWPAEHLPTYPPWNLDAHNALDYLYPLGVLTVLAVLWAFRRRIGQGPFLATAFYVITLMPILGFLYWSLMKRSFVQDHYQYVACIGPFLLFAHAVEILAPRVFRKAPHPRFLAYGALTLALIIPLALVAHLHVRLYHNAETLFRETYEHYPKAPEVAATYAFALICDGKMREALPVAEEAVAVAPGKAVHWKRKGDILLFLQRMDEARVAYEKALSIDPNYDGLVSNYAASFLYADPPDPKPVLSMLENAVKQQPDDQYLQGNLGMALYHAGRPAEAAPHLETALRLDELKPAPEVLYIYGKLLLERGEAVKAQPYLQRAVSADKTKTRYADALLQAESAIKARR
ncbi:TPA: hypothetical protein DDW35_10005 [Candidatus Sumerlaeota bacterium]|nr:hypothetical protein [Candidatus Sumerlaeota bacterium]